MRLRYFYSFFFLILSLLFSSCYYQGTYSSDAWNLTEKQLDSISFYTTHHYTQNFNFYVTGDSLQLIEQHPTEYVNGLVVDTFFIYRGDRVVVADITIMPTDSVDSVWVKIARDQQSIGWIHENQMLPDVAPDTPISRFIDYFSNSHMLIFLAIIVLMFAVFLLRRLFRLGAKIVHFNDIDSFYPTFFCLLVSFSAVLYGSIQLFAPEMWRHYYYHPTLNPFSVPFFLSVFLISVWILVIVGIAAADDVRRHVKSDEMLVYFLGWASVCAVDYVVFSISTLYYIGYLLYLLYAYFSVRFYLRRTRINYLCGECGYHLHSKGRCPRCGAVNE